MQQAPTSLLGSKNYSGLAAERPPKTRNLSSWRNGCRNAPTRLRFSSFASKNSGQNKRIPDRMIDTQRSALPPPSLALQQGWRAADVLERLWADFLGKCYLCEMPVPPAGFEVDHRVPRDVDPTREHDWTNLHPACRHCNARRLRKLPVGGLLFPADGDRVEARIVQTLEMGRNLDPVFEARDLSDQAAANTAAELDENHHARRTQNESSRLKARDLRESIRCEVTRYLLIEREFLHSGGAAARGRVRQMLERDAPYTMLIRSIADP